MRTHPDTGAPTRVVVARGLRDRTCSLCANGVTVGVKASAPPIAIHHLFCKGCSDAIGRVAGSIGKRKAVRK